MFFAGRDYEPLKIHGLNLNELKLNLSETVSVLRIEPQM